MPVAGPKNHGEDGVEQERNNITSPDITGANANESSLSSNYTSMNELAVQYRRQPFENLSSPIAVGPQSR